MGNTLTPAAVLAASKTIGTALKAGAVTPRSALGWARRAAAGEDIGWVEHLTPAPGQREANQAVLAHSNQAVLRLLSDALGRGGADLGVSDEYLHLFPPQPGHEVEPSTTPVYETGGLAPNGARRAVPYASAGDTPVPDELDDAAADALFPGPGLTASQSVQAAHVARAEAAA